MQCSEWVGQTRTEVAAPNKLTVVGITILSRNWREAIQLQRQKRWGDQGTAG